MSEAGDYAPREAWIFDKRNDGIIMEMKRQQHLQDQRLAGHQFVLSNDNSIADIAIFAWYDAFLAGWTNASSEFLRPRAYPNLKRWGDQIAAQPAVQRGGKGNRIHSAALGALCGRCNASDFDQ